MLEILGLILILIGFLILIWPFEDEGRTPQNGEYSKEDEKHKKIRGGAVIMIGPIPIVFGSDPKAAVLLMLIAFAIMLVWMIGFKLG